MITNTLEHRAECLDECVAGVNRPRFLNGLNGKLSVPDPEMVENKDAGLNHFLEAVLRVNVPAEKYKMWK